MEWGHDGEGRRLGNLAKIGKCPRDEWVGSLSKSKEDRYPRYLYLTLLPIPGLVAR